MAAPTHHRAPLSEARSQCGPQQTTFLLINSAETSVKRSPARKTSFGRTACRARPTVCDAKPVQHHVRKCSSALSRSRTSLLVKYGDAHAHLVIVGVAQAMAAVDEAEAT